MRDFDSTSTTHETFFEDARSLDEQLGACERSWMPHKESESPRVLRGLVIDRSEGTSNYDVTRKVPAIRVLEMPANIEWTARGFHGYLASEIKRKNPRVGDYIAVVYRGTKPGREGESDAHDYKLVCQRNPDKPAAEVEPIEDEEEDGNDDDSIPF